MGRTLLAFSSSTIEAEIAQIPSLQQFTERTITDRRALAAIGLQGPSVRLTPERLEELAPIVQSAAAEVAALVIRY